MSGECASGRHDTCPGYWRVAHPCPCPCHQRRRDPATLVCVGCIVDTRDDRIPHDEPACAIFDGASLCAEHLGEKLRRTAEALTSRPL